MPSKPQQSDALVMALQMCLDALNDARNYDFSNAARACAFAQATLEQIKEKRP